MKNTSSFPVIRINKDSNLTMEVIAEAIQSSLHPSTQFMKTSHLIFDIDVKEDEVDNLMETLLPVCLCWSDCGCGFVAICSSNVNSSKRFLGYQLRGKYLMYSTVEEAQHVLHKYTQNN